MIITHVVSLGSFLQLIEDYVLMGSLMCSFILYCCIFFPQNIGKTVLPKSANEVKLISSGKILENNKTVGQCKAPFGDIAGGVIIMHVVVQPSLAKSKAGKFHSFYWECIFL
jgi:hypothetical protein